MKKHVAVTIRIKPEDHKALKLFSIEAKTSINEIMNILIRKGTPAKYYHVRYGKPEDDWLNDD